MGRSRSGAATTSANSTGSPGCGTPGYAEECGLPPRAWCTPTTRPPCTWWTRSPSPTTAPATPRSTSATRPRSAPRGGPSTLAGVATCTGRPTTPDGRWLEPRPTAVVCDHDAEGRAVLERELGVETTPAHKSVLDGIQAVQARLRVAEDGKPRLFFVRGALVERDPELEGARRP